MFTLGGSDRSRTGSVRALWLYCRPVVVIRQLGMLSAMLDCSCKLCKSSVNMLVVCVCRSEVGFTSAASHMCWPCCWECSVYEVGVVYICARGSVSGGLSSTRKRSHSLLVVWWAGCVYLSILPVHYIDCCLLSVHNTQPLTDHGKLHVLASLVHRVHSLQLSPYLILTYRSMQLPPVPHVQLDTTV